MRVRVVSAISAARWAWWVVRMMVRWASSGDGPGAEVGQEFDHLAGAGYIQVRKGLVEEEKLGIGLKDAG